MRSGGPGSVGSQPYMASVELTTSCQLDCPFCYSRRRYREGDTSWNPALLKAFIHELSAVIGEGNFVTGFGGGEPLLRPRLLGLGLRESLGKGAVYTSFTTNAVATTPENTKVIEDAVGILSMPEGFVTVSLDTYKLLHSPRIHNPDPMVSRIWGSMRSLLAYAAARWRVEVPVDPPIQLSAIEYLYERGYSLALNIMVTDDIIPLLLPNPFKMNGGHWSFHEYVNQRFIQIQFLLPKPLSGLLSTPGERLAGIIQWWADNSRVKVAVDQSMYYYAGLGGPRTCMAGRKMLSIDPYMRIAPCSFMLHQYQWKPGRLHQIMEKLPHNVPRLVSECPFTRKPNIGLR